MDLGRSAEEAERLRALRRQRFENTEGEKRFRKLQEERAQRRKLLTSQGILGTSSSLDKAQKITGACTLMCPEFEREERELKNNLAPQEIMAGTRNRADPAKTVKTFHRSAAGNEDSLPEDLRTPDTLVRTLDYLIDTVIAGDPQMTSCHGFVRDRTRSIRQDLTILNIRDHYAVTLCERIARFHIVSLHVMCGQKGFEEQQDMEQLRNTLKSLIEMYGEHRRAGLKCPNEAEFYAYYIVAHLRDSDAKRVAERLPSNIFNASIVQQALKLHRLGESSNVITSRQDPGNLFAAPNLTTQFFRAVASNRTPLLLACLAEYKFPSIRRAAIKAMNMAFPYQDGKEYPTEELAAMLAFDSPDEVREFCALFDLSFTEHGIKLGERVDKKLVFKEPDQKPRRKSPNMRVVGFKFRISPMDAINLDLDSPFLSDSTSAGTISTGSLKRPLVTSAFAPKISPVSNGFSFPNARPPIPPQATTTAAMSVFAGFSSQNSQPLKTFASAPTSMPQPVSSNPPLPPAAVKAPSAELFAANSTNMFNIPSEKPKEKKATPSTPSFTFANQPSTLTTKKLPPQPGNLMSKKSTRTETASTTDTAILSKQASAVPVSKPVPTTTKTVVWNKPRPRINWTSLTNALYDDLIHSLTSEAVQQPTQQARRCGAMANGLSRDITDAIINYTTAFIAYEESYRCVLLSQADSFCRKSTLRLAWSRWSMELAVKQQDRALEHQYINDLDEIIDNEYSDPTRRPLYYKPSDSMAVDNDCLYNSLSSTWTPVTNQQMECKDKGAGISADFWESCYIGRDGFRALNRSLQQLGSPPYEAVVCVTGAQDTSSILSSWLWWQVDPDISGERLVSYTEPSTSQTLTICHSYFKNVSHQLTGYVVALNGEPISGSDLNKASVYTRISATIESTIDMIRQRRHSMSNTLPVLFVFWYSDSKAKKSMERLVTKLTKHNSTVSSTATTIHTVGLDVDGAKRQLASGFKWLCKHLYMARKESLTRMTRAYEIISDALLQSLQRISSLLLSTNARSDSLSDECMADIFNQAVDVANELIGLLNTLLFEPATGSKLAKLYPHASLDTGGIGKEYFSRTNSSDNGLSLLANPILGASIANMFSTEPGKSLLNACIWALASATRHQLNMLQQSVPSNSYVEKYVVVTATQRARDSANKLAAYIIRLQQTLANDVAMASPSPQLLSDDMMSVSSVHTMQSTKTTTSNKRYRNTAGDVEHGSSSASKLSRLQQAMARASQYLQ